MDDERAVLRLARRRRLGRRAGLAAVPVGLVVWFVVASWGDGVPDALSLALLVVLGGAVAVGWWWLEHSAGGSVTELLRPRGRPGPAGRCTAEELDDARAELALRTCSPPPPGGRARVEGLVDRWSRDGRSVRWAAPLYACLLGLLVVMHRSDPDRGIPWQLGAVWVVLAGLALARGLRRGRTARRWLDAHGTAPEVAGHP